MVGREAELAVLRGVSEGLLAGRGAIVSITGEAGIGKSRLLAEWQATHDEHVRWLEGRSFAGASAVPFGPFLDMCRRYAGITDEDSEEDARVRLHETIDRILPGDAEALAIIAGMLGMRPDRPRRTCSAPSRRKRSGRACSRSSAACSSDWPPGGRRSS